MKKTTRNSAVLGLGYGVHMHVDGVISKEAIRANSYVAP